MEGASAPRTPYAAHAVLDTTARVLTLGRHTLPIVRAWAGLVRAEGDLARDSLASLLIAAAVAALGAFVLLTALIGGAMLGLRELGWPVWAATALPAGVGLCAAGLAGGFAYTRFVRLTFPETRRRIVALLEVLDDS